MVAYKVINAATFESPSPRKPLGESMTESDGYRDTEYLVVEMLAAGERLQNLRREEFDIGIEDDPNGVEVEETRMRDFDPADITSMIDRLKKGS